MEHHPELAVPYCTTSLTTGKKDPSVAPTGAKGENLPELDNGDRKGDQLTKLPPKHVTVRFLLWAGSFLAQLREAKLLVFCSSLSRCSSAKVHERNFMKYLLGKKLEMTQVYRADGSVVPVTLVAVEPCTVAAVRQDPQGRAVAIIGTGKNVRAAKPQKSEFAGHGPFRKLAQVSLPEGENVEAGQVLTVNTFAVGDKVSVVGTSKGRGFQGVVKRHGFAGHPTTHGHKDQVRKSGSIGAGGIQRVFKGIRMAGRMGSDRVTIKHLEVMTIDSEKNIIGIKGALPGARGSFVTITSSDGNVWHK